MGGRGGKSRPMSRKIPEKMGDPTGKYTPIFTDHETNLGDPAETLTASGFAVKSWEVAGRSVGDPTPPKIPEFITPAKAVELTGKGISTVKRHCQEGKFPGATKTLVDGIEAWQIPIASLPIHAQKKMAEEVKAKLADRIGLVPAAKASPALAHGEYATLWEGYERSGATFKRMAETALDALVAFLDLLDAGFSIGKAEAEIEANFELDRITLWRHRKAVKGHPRQHWLPLLAPKYKGGRHPAEFTPEAYEYIRGNYLNTSKTPLAVVMETARALAPGKGWVIPSDDTIAKRLKKEPAWLHTVGRIGPKALERSYPAVEKDYASLRLHELWESDGRKADVMCRWPDGGVSRPFVIVWREVRTRLVLGVKGYRQPTAEGVLAAFGMALERAQAIPENAKLDNGREYAAKSVTGGQETRYRFKITPDEPPGILTRIGTKARWAKPYRGQDKPIESFWRFVADRCDKAPEFQGAYCGRNTVAKPEDFDPRKAIPIEVYAAKLAAVLEFFNHRPHSGHGMDGKTPMQLYKELLADTEVRQPDASHIRLCKMGMAAIKPAKADASLTLKIDGYGAVRYWSQDLARLDSLVLSRKLFVYYDLENPTAPVSAYDGQNWLCDAEPIDRIPFLEEGGVRAAAHMKTKNEWLKPKAAALKAAKAAGQSDLPGLEGVASLTPLPAPIHSVQIEAPRAAASAPEWEGPIVPTGNPGESINRETGQIYRARAPAIPPATVATDAEEEKRYAELERLAREKRLPEWLKTPVNKIA